MKNNDLNVQRQKSAVIDTRKSGNSQSPPLASEYHYPSFLHQESLGDPSFETTGDKQNLE